MATWGQPPGAASSGSSSRSRCWLCSWPSRSRCALAATQELLLSTTGTIPLWQGAQMLHAGSAAPAMCKQLSVVSAGAAAQAAFCLSACVPLMQVHDLSAASHAAAVPAGVMDGLLLQLSALRSVAACVYGAAAAGPAAGAAGGAAPVGGPAPFTGQRLLRLVDAWLLELVIGALRLQQRAAAAAAAAVHVGYCLASE